MPVMLRRSQRLRRRSGRMIWAMLAFMLVSAAIIAGLSKYYLLPALDAYNHAQKPEREKLAAHALLLMIVVLFLLGLLMLLTFRAGQFFFPRAESPRTKTKYVDAWAESGKRLKMPDDKSKGGSE